MGFVWCFIGCSKNQAHAIYLAIIDQNYDVILNVDLSTFECRLSFGAENRTQKSTYSYFEQRCKLREYFRHVNSLC